MSIEFFVSGVPVPKGSAKAFMPKGARFPVVMQDNAAKQKPWASDIKYTAIQHNCPMLDGPVILSLTFVMPRLKAHFRTNGDVKPNAPVYHVSKPDLDKLVRCVKDALTSVAWKDDSVVCEVHTTKRYGDQPGVHIRISPVATSP